jgi:leucyl-tRNA synthetase
MMQDLAKKPDYYNKLLNNLATEFYKKAGDEREPRDRIKGEWAEFESLPIIQTPTSDLLAPHLVKKLKIQSPKDTQKLQEAKELAYKEGFYQGVMLVGDFKGEKVEVAKPKVREQLIKGGEAFAYAEPENKVVSRSGDEW